MRYSWTLRVKVWSHDISDYFWSKNQNTANRLMCRCLSDSQWGSFLTHYPETLKLVTDRLNFDRTRAFKIGELSDSRMLHLLACTPAERINNLDEQIYKGFIRIICKFLTYDVNLFGQDFYEGLKCLESFLRNCDAKHALWMINEPILQSGILICIMYDSSKILVEKNSFNSYFNLELKTLFFLPPSKRSNVRNDSAWYLGLSCVMIVLTLNTFIFPMWNFSC